MLKIYGVYQSRASRNYWMAGELGLEFESVPVIQGRRLEAPLADGAPINTQSQAFLAINPLGEIPVIDDGGLVLSESIAINLYLARKHGGPLSSANASEDGEILMWSLFSVNAIEPEAVKIVLTHDAGLENTPAGQDKIAVATRLLRKAFGRLDAHLASRDYLVGNRFTVADLNVAEICRYAMTQKTLTDAHPHLVAWYERCHERPAFEEMWRRRAQEG